MVRDRRARYDSVGAAHVDIPRADSAIRAAFRRLKAIYPAAVFPDVYFAIGRFNSGGTASKHGLLIGAEMYRDASALPAIVSHELIHFQQDYANRTPLEHAFLEGERRLPRRNDHRGADQQCRARVRSGTRARLVAGIPAAQLLAESGYDH